MDLICLTAAATRLHGKQIHLIFEPSRRGGTYVSVITFFLRSRHSALLHCRHFRRRRICCTSPHQLPAGTSRSWSRRMRIRISQKSALTMSRSCDACSMARPVPQSAANACSALVPNSL